MVMWPYGLHCALAIAPVNPGTMPVSLPRFRLHPPLPVAQRCLFIVKARGHQ
jgi:hypothetical protein